MFFEAELALLRVLRRLAVAHLLVELVDYLVQLLQLALVLLVLGPRLLRLNLNSRKFGLQFRFLVCRCAHLGSERLEFLLKRGHLLSNSLLLSCVGLFLSL